MFASLDINRSISVTAIAHDGTTFPVHVPFGQVTTPDVLSGPALSRILMMPTKGKLNELASVVLAGHLMLNAADTVPPILSRSAMANAVGAMDFHDEYLELRGPLRKPESVQTIKEIRIRVLRRRYDNTTKRLSSEQVGPSGIATQR